MEESWIFNENFNNVIDAHNRMIELFLKCGSKLNIRNYKSSEFGIYSIEYSIDLE